MCSLSNVLVSSNWVQKLIYRIRSLASIPALMYFIWEVFTICSFSVFWLCSLDSSIEFLLYQLNVFLECRRGKRKNWRTVIWKRVQKRRRRGLGRWRGREGGGETGDRSSCSSTLEDTNIYKPLALIHESRKCVFYLGTDQSCRYWFTLTIVHVHPFLLSFL